MAWSEHTYPDSGALAASLAVTLRQATDAAIDGHGHALLALAGGRTPLPAYRTFAAMPLDWSRVVVMPTDERCVPHGDQASNVGELQSIFAPAPRLRIEALTTPDGDPATSERHARAVLADHRRPFDVVVLGMGADAHTASLFPGAPQLAVAVDPATGLEACRIDPDPLPPEAPYPRISLTAARLLHANAIHLVVTGSAKRAVLDEVYASPDVMRQPVAAILHAPDALVHVHWSP